MIMKVLIISDTVTKDITSQRTPHSNSLIRLELCSQTESVLLISDEFSGARSELLWLQLILIAVERTQLAQVRLIHPPHLQILHNHKHNAKHV